MLSQPSSKKEKKPTFIINSQYKTILISNTPRFTLGDLIQFVASYPKKAFLLRNVFNKWNYFKLSHLLTLYIQLYLRNIISTKYKYHSYVDKYYKNIPTVSYIQQHFRPYLDHIISQIKDDANGVNSHCTTVTPDFRSLVATKLQIYMNKPMLNGPILTLSMHKQDLLIFGYIHRFKDENNFYSQTIPWDVIKLIHAFFDKINKEYLEKFESIKQNIIETESQIYDLKNNQYKRNLDEQYIMNEIHEKQYELLTLYNKSKDIQFQEEYFPHLINEFVINNKYYQLTAKEFALKIDQIPFSSFERAYSENTSNNWIWGYTLNVNSFLFALLDIVVSVGNTTYKKENAKKQIDIYDDYISLKLSPSGYISNTLDAKKVCDKIGAWISEIFDKENEWSEIIDQKATEIVTQKKKKKKLK
eukprot:503574_1